MLLSQAANPALVRGAARATPVVVVADPADCSLAVRPHRQGQVRHQLRHRQGRAGQRRRRLRQPAPRRPGAWRVVKIGAAAVASVDGARPRRAGAEGRDRQGRRTRIGAALAKAGYPAKSDPAQRNVAADPGGAAGVHGRRDGALRPDGRGAGRAVPDPGALHRAVVALSPRHRLDRRLPAGGVVLDRGRHRRHLRRPLVPGDLHRHQRRRLPALPARDPRAVAGRSSTLQTRLSSRRPQECQSRRRTPTCAPGSCSRLHAGSRTLRRADADRRRRREVG